MLKRLLGLILATSLACAGVAQAQSPAPSGTATTKPSTTMSMPMMGDVAVPNRPSDATLTASELAAIGVGVVAGALVFQGAMWHGMTIVGAALGGWVGDYLYNMHASAKTEKTAG